MEIIKEQVKKKFYGHDTLYSKVEPIYPHGVEREYIRLVNAYMAEYKKVLVKNLAQIKKAIISDRNLKAALRLDDEFEIKQLVEQLFKKMDEDMKHKPTIFGLRKKLENLAHLTRKLTIKEWKKVCKATLGVNIMDDYYLGEFYKQMINVWVDDNIGLIASIPQDSLNEMKQIVQDGFATGATIKEITKNIEYRYGVSKRKARLLAVDQLAKLYADMSERQQRDAGCTEYIWSTSRDQRVRDSHKALEGKKFDWNNPPIVDAKRGRRCHPGKDYACRCVAIPVFKYANIKLPIQEGK